MMGWVKTMAALLILVSPRGCFPGSLSVVINEVLYDPEGQDTGREFVELYNRSDADACLHGYELATGNGAYPGRWTSEWRGSLSDTIRARGFFLIGEDQVCPPPDFTTALDLQNGPDGVRLLTPQFDADVLGWGDHDFSEYYEGCPAPASGPGASLGRDPDGRDTGDNSADFRSQDVLSPGDFNHPPFDLAVETACLSRYTEPEHAAVQVIARIANLGTASCGAGALLVAAASGLTGSSPVHTGILPGASSRMAVHLPNPGNGLHGLTVWVDFPADGRRGNDTLSASMLIWPAPAVINEFMFKPGPGACEWIEVVNPGGSCVSLDGWTLEDSAGKRRLIAQGPLDLAPGQYLLVVEDLDGFRAVYPAAAATALEAAGGWPTLNDTDGRDGHADMVVIRDRFGTCVDSVAYCGAWSNAGTSVERIDARARSSRAYNWSPHYGSAGGSPGAANSVSLMLPQPGGRLGLSPYRFSPDGDGTDDLLSVSVEIEHSAVVRLKVFDIKGRPIATLLDGDLVDERRITFWDGDTEGGGPAPVGVYIVLMEARAVSGGQTLHDKQAVVLVRR